MAKKKESKRTAKGKADKPSDLVQTLERGADALRKVGQGYSALSTRVDGVEQNYQGVEQRVNALEKKKTFTDSTARSNVTALRKEVEGNYAKKSDLGAYATVESVDAKVKAAQAPVNKDAVQLSKADKEALKRANAIYDAILGEKK
ncbi:hypothetical protein KY312_04845 [Candidatus Woesearchaeota archaeon]|nr:hypothetical protein [Candidatus Woesearchaeota archaeon]